MAHEKPAARVPWLSFYCPSCRAHLRIKAAYAGMQGRCPECGWRIPALRPELESRRPASGDEPGLVPLEEEWPEPARLVNEDRRESYGVAPPPEEWPEPLPPAAPEGESYALAAGEWAAPPEAPSEPGAPPYPVLEAVGPPPARVAEAALPDPKRVAQLLREPLPPPPAHPLWEGIYTFPWRPGNLGVWLFLGFDFSLFALMATAVVALLDVGGPAMIGVPLLLPAMAIVFFWAGMYASGCFLAIVEDTAAGNDRVAWPKGGGLLDGLGRFVYLFWLGGCGFCPVGIFWLAGGSVAADDWGWVIALIPGLIFFPLQLLSALSAGSWWMVFDRRVVAGLLQKPQALVLMVLPALVLMVPCFWLGRQIMTHVSFALVPVAGLTWSAVFLIYARLLGRVGWILTGGKARSPKKIRNTKSEIRNKPETRNPKSKTS